MTSCADGRREPGAEVGWGGGGALWVMLYADDAGVLWRSIASLAKMMRLMLAI